jgi:GDP-4-dehydro-6-deoxy-D-mannose reductase
VLTKAHNSARIVAIGSSAEYGRSDQTPIHEDRPLRPVTEYGLTKVFGYQLSQFAVEQGARVVYARPFNLTGPGVSATNALSEFARRIASIARKEAPPLLSVGNLDVWRDFTDVRDAARACVLLLSAPPGGVYNICSGQATNLADAVQVLIRASGIPIKVASGGGVEAIPFQVGNPSKLHSLGWRPQVTLEASLSDSLAWWIENGV